LRFGIIFLQNSDKSHYSILRAEDQRSQDVVWQNNCSGCSKRTGSRGVSRAARSGRGRIGH